MAYDFAPFPDAEASLMDAVRGWLADDGVPASAVGTVAPIDLPAGGVFVRLQRIGGSDDRFTDSPLISVDVLATSRPRAYDLAEEIRARLLGFPFRAGNMVVDQASTETAPQRLPWDVAGVVRFHATYRLRARR